MKFIHTLIILFLIFLQFLVKIQRKDIIQKKNLLKLIQKMQRNG